MSESECDIAVINAHILTMNETMDVINPGYILIKNSSIIALGSMDEYNKQKNKLDSKEEINAQNGIVLPGFINAHCHLPMTLFRGIADDLPLKQWLNEYIWPIEAKLSPRDCFIGAQLAALEMIQGGTTTACDMYFHEQSVLKALEEIGFRGILGYGMLDFGNEEKRSKEINETKRLIQFSKNNAKLSSVIISPHAPYSCSKELLMEAQKVAEIHNLPIQIHLAETKDEINEMKKKEGKTPTKYLSDIGFLSNRLVAAHSIWLSNEDIQLLKNADVKVVHNPSSNLKLGSGIFNYSSLNKKRILIGLGTDGAASNNNLSMLEEVRLSCFIHKGIKRNTELLPATEAIKMATINGAKVFGKHQEIGSLEIGKKADIALIDKKHLNLWPPHNPYSLVAYSAYDSNIITTIIDGKIIMKNREFLTIDKGKVMQEAKEAITQLIDNVNLNQFKEKRKYL